ncbi:MAG: hypothetical protein KDA25_07475 [Phycisphaerales bacterium]|nr:hypothetical protein [Phycisphaerales bacterium]
MPDRNVTPLPPVFEGLLDDDRLAQLIADLSSCTQVLHVQVRSRGGGSADRTATLDEAAAALRAGDTRSVQIRYRYEGAAWCDTLLAQTGGVRLIRIRQDLVPSPAS